MILCAPLTPDKPLGLPSLGRPKLLIVDDQPINIQVLYQVFSADHDVFMATSGAQALAVCASQSPDLILLDIEMPEMNGFEVCARLKANPDTQDIPIIFITAHIDEETETRGLQAGAVDFISKPINRNIVQARVKTQLMLKAQADLLRQLVYRDGLTEVYNRRYFDQRLNTEWNLALHSGKPLSLIMIDVDFFKHYNDLYGHLAGDDCLRQVATTIRASLKRSTDMVARYGGEEFICLLPNTDLASATLLAEEIRLHVVDQHIEYANSPVMPLVSISLGVCCKEKDTEGTLTEFLRQVDIQLYQAKKLGRNQTCAAEMTAS